MRKWIVVQRRETCICTFHCECSIILWWIHWWNHFTCERGGGRACWFIDQPNLHRWQRSSTRQLKCTLHRVGEGISKNTFKTLNEDEFASFKFKLMLLGMQDDRWFLSLHLISRATRWRRKYWAHFCKSIYFLSASIFFFVSLGDDQPDQQERRRRCNFTSKRMYICIIIFSSCSFSSTLLLLFSSCSSWV